MPKSTLFCAKGRLKAQYFKIRDLPAIHRNGQGFDMAVEQKAEQGGRTGCMEAARDNAAAVLCIYGNDGKNKYAVCRRR